MIQELDSIQQTYDLDNCPRRFLDHREFLGELDHFQKMDNSLFEMGAEWTFDNPLFELDEGDTSYSRDEDEIGCRVWDPGAVIRGEPWSPGWSSGVNSVDEQCGLCTRSPGEVVMSCGI